MMTTALAFVVSAGLAVQPGAGGEIDREAWARAEAQVLSGQRALTTAERFFKAGEAYFSPDAKAIIFQATPLPGEGEEASPHYAMYVGALEFDVMGEVLGLGEVVRLSGEGAATTCGWFHPSEAGAVMYGSTLVAPVEEDQPGYQRDSGRYRWAFPTEMQIVRQSFSFGEAAGTGAPEVIFERDGYTAEGSYSPDGRSILYAQIDGERSAELGRPDADLYVYDTRLRTSTPLITDSGYDGGPFFSPARGVASWDGLPKWICYRSDRLGNNLLQLFIAELAYGDRTDPARITGIEREVQLTDNRHVNWAPYWHPSGRFLIYATSEVSHRNYEVFALPVFDEDGELIEGARPVRLTFAEGFDGLPVFSPDGELMMWTAQRGDDALNNGSPSSQLWIADVNEGALMEIVFGR